MLSTTPVTKIFSWVQNSICEPLKNGRMVRLLSEASVYRCFELAPRRQVKVGRVAVLSCQPTIVTADGKTKRRFVE